MLTERFDCLVERSDYPWTAYLPKSMFVVVVCPMRVEDLDRTLQIKMKMKDKCDFIISGLSPEFVNDVKIRVGETRAYDRIIRL